MKIKSCRMKKILCFLALLISVATVRAQIYMSKACEIGFFSASTVEDIKALNTSCKPVMNASSGDVQVKIPMQGFIFHSSLMQEHFNENYLESDKYPDAIFKGKIKEKLTLSRDTLMNVTVSGTLNMHGVEKPIAFSGTVKVSGKQLVLFTKFKIHIADYNIKIPSVVNQNIAEDIEVTVNSTLDPYALPAKK